MHWTKDLARRADVARTVAAMHRGHRQAARRRRKAAQARRAPHARTIAAPPARHRAPTIAEAFEALEARLLELDTMRRALTAAIEALRP